MTNVNPSLKFLSIIVCEASSNCNIYFTVTSSPLPAFLPEPHKKKKGENDTIPVEIEQRDKEKNKTNVLNAVKDKIASGISEKEKMNDLNFSASKSINSTLPYLYSLLKTKLFQ